MKNKFYTPEMDKEMNLTGFELVNQESGGKIHDEKFKTKPTTFAKDAFKRFCKNKSSVVAAIIIGILLAGSIIVPLVSPFDLDSVKPDQSKLVPKLFASGTGWWDGTKQYDNQLYDRRADIIAGGVDGNGFKENAILSKSGKEITLTTYSPYAWDGYVYVVTDAPVTTDAEYEKTNLLIKNYTTFSVKNGDALNAEITIGNIEGINDFIISDGYQFFVTYTEAGATGQLNLTDGYVPYQDVYKFNISEKLEAQGLDNVSKVSLSIKCKPMKNTEAKNTYMLIKSVKMTSANEELQSILDQINFYDRTTEEVQKQYKENPSVILSDANAVGGYGASSGSTYPVGYWQTIGTKSSYGAKAMSYSVVYDEYEHVYGVREMAISELQMDNYINSGYCRFKKWAIGVPLSAATPENFSLEKNPFVVLSDGCPIITVKQAIYTKTNTGGTWQFQCDVMYYRYLGMSKAPSFIFGTDSQGYDLFTRSMSSLKTSLLVAIVCVAITMVMGLIWGSISGYFGGTVDLVMERITDVLNGLPGIVLMTLFMIIWGRTIIVFALSVIVTGWIGTASTTRTQFYRFRDREYVLASRTLGASDARLIFKHILPNGLGTIITSSVLKVPAFVMSEATLAYLGVGLQTTESFGVILSSNQRFIGTYPMLIVWPAILISLLMISFNLFGNGLRDAINPTLKGGE